ncbi:type II secretion system protein [Deltaproteobacteria bacterium TL4]
MKVLRSRFLKTFKSFGFSLMEVVIAIGVMGILGSVVVPVAIDTMERTRQTAATSDTQAIARAIMAYFDDVKQSFKNVTGGAAKGLRSEPPVAVKVLEVSKIAAATIPANYANPSSTANWDSIASHLITNSVGQDIPADAYGTGFRGPYLPNIPIDPWKARYFIMGNFTYDNLSAPLIVISAGTDRVIQTSHSDTNNYAAGNNDIVQLVKGF